MSSIETVRLLRVFVSSPGDVAAERDVLYDVVTSINRTDGSASGFRLELFRWEADVAPRIGPSPQIVMDEQAPLHDIYIGIMSTRFGTSTRDFESGTESEFREALRKWSEAGSPWITFYFNTQVQLSGRPEEAKQYLKVCEFRSELEKLGIVATYDGIRGSNNSFYESVSLHLRKIAAHIAAQLRIQRESAAQKEPLPRKHRELMRVFVASPSDVFRERSCMPKVIESLNKTLGRLADIVVELWRWEADAPPAAGEPQSLIDPELDQADVVVVIFWNRFGIPTHSGATGTESEVLRSLSRWKQSGKPKVMMYFCQRPANLTKEELEQRKMVLDFRESVSSLALTVNYEDLAEFEWRARDDLFVTLARLSQRTSPDSV